MTSGLEDSFIYLEISTNGGCIVNVNMKAPALHL